MAISKSKLEDIFFFPVFLATISCYEFEFLVIGFIFNMNLNPKLLILSCFFYFSERMKHIQKDRARKRKEKARKRQKEQDKERKSKEKKEKSMEKLPKSKGNNSEK